MENKESNGLNIDLDKFLSKIPGKDKKKIGERIRMVYNLVKIKLDKAGKFRDSGEPYFEHIRRVVDILIKEFFDYVDYDRIIVALLHDIIEETDIDENTIYIIAGKENLERVRLLSKNYLEKNYSIIKESGGEEAVKNIRELYFQRLIDEGDEVVVDVKLADRIDNLRTMSCWTNERIEKKLIETEKYIIPLAEKFGRNKAKKLIQEEVSKLRLKCNLSD